MASGDIGGKVDTSGNRSYDVGAQALRLQQQRHLIAKESRDDEESLSFDVRRTSLCRYPGRRTSCQDVQKVRAGAGVCMKEKTDSLQAARLRQ